MFGQRGRMALLPGDTSSTIEMESAPGADHQNAPTLDLGFSIALDRFDIEKHPDDSIVMAAIPERKFMREFAVSSPTPVKLGWSAFSIRSMRRVEHFERRPDLEADPKGVPGILVSMSDGKELTALIADPTAGTLSESPLNEGAVSIRFQAASRALTLDAVKSAFPAPKHPARGTTKNASNPHIPTLAVSPSDGKGATIRMPAKPNATWRDEASGSIITILRYFPALRLDDNKVPFSAGDEPDNPAVEVQVQTKGTNGKSVKQWVFARPEFRNFSHRGAAGSLYKFEFHHPAFADESDSPDHASEGPAIAATIVTLVRMPDSRLAYVVDTSSSPQPRRLVGWTGEGQIIRWGRDNAESLSVNRVVASARRVWREGESNNDKASPAVLVELSDNVRSESVWITERQEPRLVPVLGGKVRLAVVRKEGMVKRYVSAVRVDGQSSPTEIEVNRPLKHGGWTFYQASYYQDEHSGRMATVLDARRDPGVLVIFLGFALLMIGMIWFYMERMRSRDN
jgi:hypothetical protein